MKSNLMVVVVLLLIIGCGGGGGGGNSPSPTPTPGNDYQNMSGGMIVINEDSHEIFFDLSDSYIKGVISDEPITSDMVKNVAFSSDKVGWESESSAIGRLENDYAEVQNTANNDEGNWILILHDDTILWFNVDMWDIEGKPYVIENNMVKYGNYKFPEIVFEGGEARINFGSNLLSGLVESGIPASHIELIRWNSDRVGWGTESSAYAFLETDENGNIIAVIDGMPNNDLGNFTAVKHDGSEVWFNINMWDFETNVSLTSGMIEYIMP